MANIPIKKSDGTIEVLGSDTKKDISGKSLDSQNQELNSFVQNMDENNIKQVDKKVVPPLPRKSATGKQPLLNRNHSLKVFSKKHAEKLKEGKPPIAPHAGVDLDDVEKHDTIEVRSENKAYNEAVARLTNDFLRESGILVLLKDNGDLYQDLRNSIELFMRGVKDKSVVDALFTKISSEVTQDQKDEYFSLIDKKRELLQSQKQIQTQSNNNLESETTDSQSISSKNEPKKNVEALKKLEKQYVQEDVYDITKNIKPVNKDSQKEANKTAQIPKSEKTGMKKESNPTVTKISPPVKKMIVQKENTRLTMKDVVPPKEAVFGEKNPPVQITQTDSGPKLVNPSEELKMLSLKDFRRLADTPENTIEKIKEKIHLLEEQSYLERIKGIENWKKSQVHQLYLQMGYDALTQEISLDELIINYNQEKKDVLTKAEFDAIIKLNIQLAY